MIFGTPEDSQEFPSCARIVPRRFSQDFQSEEVSKQYLKPQNV